MIQLTTARGVSARRDTHQGVVDKISSETFGETLVLRIEYCSGAGVGVREHTLASQWSGTHASCAVSCSTSSINRLWQVRLGSERVPATSRSLTLALEAHQNAADLPDGERILGNAQVNCTHWSAPSPQSTIAASSVPGGRECPTVQDTITRAPLSPVAYRCPRPQPMPARPSATPACPLW